MSESAQTPTRPTPPAPHPVAPRIGVLGGTFNPPHRGHLHAATLAKDALALDQVLFIPTNIPPHKQLPQHTASAADRCEMVRQLLQETPWAVLDDREIRRGGPSYTVDTLRELVARSPVTPGLPSATPNQVPPALYLIIGTDMLLSFDRIWRAPRAIAQLATLAVCARSDDDWDALECKADTLRRTLDARITLIPGTSLTISSTELRAALRHIDASRAYLETWLPPAVLAFIQQKHLYGF